MRRSRFTAVLVLAGLLACSSDEGDDGDTGGEAGGDGADAADGMDDGDGDGDGGSSGADADAGDDDGSDSGGTDESGGGDGETGGDDGSGDGGTSGGGLPDCGFDPGLAFDPTGEDLQFESADKGVCLRLKRTNLGPGDMANTNYGFVEVQLGPPGEVVLVDDENGCYKPTHHNFLDWVHAWTGDRRYDFQLYHEDHGGAWTYTLHVFEQGPLGGDCTPFASGSGLIDEIELFPVN